LPSSVFLPPLPVPLHITRVTAGVPSLFSVLQEEVELLRSAKFTPTITDSYAPATPDAGRRDISGGTKAVRTVTSKGDGNTYTILTVVDNDPLSPEFKTKSSNQTHAERNHLDRDAAVRRRKLVTSYPTKVVFRRVRAN
jgi:hypothetical protein